MKLADDFVQVSSKIGVLCALTVLSQVVWAAQDPLSDGADGTNWPSYGRSYGEQHFSPLDQINEANISRLRLAWYLDLQPGATTTQPIEVDGVLYFAMGYSVVHAVEAASGRQLWKFDPKVYNTAAQKMRAGWGSRGIGWWQGKIYTVTQDGYVIALDSKSGKQLWSTPTLDVSDSTYVSGPPRVFDGIVVIGNAGDNGVNRGLVTALDAQSGKVLWRFWTVPGNPGKGFENEAMAMASKTWSGEWWKYGGGGAPWNAFSYDPQTQTIYVGTDNGYPYNHRVRSAGKGDNLFVASVIALDAKTGAYKWHYQANPADDWDYSFAMDLELADLVIDGRMRKVLMSAPKNGFYYVIDRLDGKFISAQPFVKVNWAYGIDSTTGRPIENPAARYEHGTFTGWPSSFGGHNWQPMAYSPKSRLAYIPVIEMGGTFTDDQAPWTPPKDVQPGGTVTLTFGVKDGSPHEGTAALLAYDPVKQRPVWRVERPSMVTTGVIATAGNIVFQGSVDSKLSAFAAADGRLLWQYDTQAPALSPLLSYSVNRRQYVTILTGLGSVMASWGSVLQRYKLDYATLDRRVLTFALDGGAKLPPKRIPNLTRRSDPHFSADRESVTRGSKLFNGRCAVCHGFGAVSAGFAPDLRRSPIVVSQDAFQAVVQQGALLPNGMPKFESLSNEDLSGLRDYIRYQAHDPDLDKPTRFPGMSLH
jgi:quinohemoprotein ethanol dehydrogenase